MPIDQIRDIFERTVASHPTADLSRLKENLDAFMTGRKLVSPHPLQRPLFWYRGLRDEPWHARDELAAVDVLERSYPSIRKELEHLLAARAGFQQFRGGDPTVMEAYIKGDWTVFYFKDEFARAPDQERICDNRKLAPATAAILDSLPRLGETAFFAALEPGTHLKPHFGAENVRLFAHLGVVVPGGCGIRVGGKEATWEEGRCLVFDDSFEHEAWNFGTSTRTILLVEFWHPDLNDAEVEFFRALSPIIRENPGLLSS
jgi:aspartate beta-hydroxylase